MSFPNDRPSLSEKLKSIGTPDLKFKDDLNKSSSRPTGKHLEAIRRMQITIVPGLLAELEASSDEWSSRFSDRPDILLDKALHVVYSLCAESHRPLESEADLQACLSQLSRFLIEQLLWAWKLLDGPLSDLRMLPDSGSRRYPRIDERLQARFTRHLPGSSQHLGSANRPHRDDQEGYGVQEEELMSRRSGDDVHDSGRRQKDTGPERRVQADRLARDHQQEGRSGPRIGRQDRTRVEEPGMIIPFAVEHKTPASAPFTDWRTLVATIGSRVNAAYLLCYLIDPGWSFWLEHLDDSIEDDDEPVKLAISENMGFQLLQISGYSKEGDIRTFMLFNGKHALGMEAYHGTERRRRNSRISFRESNTTSSDDSTSDGSPSDTSTYAHPARFLKPEFKVSRTRAQTRAVSLSGRPRLDGLTAEIERHLPDVNEMGPVSDVGGPFQTVKLRIYPTVFDTSSTPTLDSSVDSAVTAYPYIPLLISLMTRGILRHIQDSPISTHQEGEDVVVREPAVLDATERDAVLQRLLSDGDQDDEL